MGLLYPVSEALKFVTREKFDKAVIIVDSGRDYKVEYKPILDESGRPAGGSLEVSTGEDYHTWWGTGDLWVGTRRDTLNVRGFYGDVYRSVSIMLQNPIRYMRGERFSFPHPLSPRRGSIGLDDALQRGHTSMWNYLQCIEEKFPAAKPTEQRSRGCQTCCRCEYINCICGCRCPPSKAYLEAQERAEERRTRQYREEQSHYRDVGQPIMGYGPSAYGAPTKK